MHSEPPALLAVCLNPAWQKTLLFPRVVLGQVNRAQRVCESGGGKGINAARAIRVGGGTVSVALFAGGHTGSLLRAELSRTGVGQIGVDVEAPTRTCTTLVDMAGGTVTELIEPSAAVPAERVAALRAQTVAALPGFAGVALCGTVPPGVPESFYGDVARAARAAGVMVLLDGVSAVAAALTAGVDVLKVNAAELRALAGEADLAAAARRCIERWGLRWVGVTDGPGAAWLFGQGTAARVEVPQLADIRSTIGAGDCATGVLLQGLVGAPPDPAAAIAAFADAIAAATASCLTDTPAGFDPACAAALRARLAVTRLPAGGIA